MEGKPKVIYEDKNFLILNKPFGTLVHPDGVKEEHCLTDWILDNYPKTEKVGESITLKNGERINKTGIVHRLDRETSGAIVVALNQESYEHLKKLFKERKVLKTYHAFVYGKVKKEIDIINRPIGKNAKDFRLWSAQRGARGKLREATTCYEVIKRNENFSFLKIRPLTGRTHQIRVHLKAINHPIVCDKLYAPKQDCSLGFNRVALHASQLEFEKKDGKKLVLRADFPEDFLQALKIFSVVPDNLF